MTEEKAIQMAYDMGAHPYSINSMVACLIKGAEIGAAERKVIDIEKAKEAFNKACGWLASYPWYNEVFEEFVKTLEE